MSLHNSQEPVSNTEEKPVQSNPDHNLDRDAPIIDVVVQNGKSITSNKSLIQKKPLRKKILKRIIIFIILKVIFNIVMFLTNKQLKEFQRMHRVTTNLNQLVPLTEEQMRAINELDKNKNNSN